VGMSSFDVIRALRRQTGFRKIGHAGTLDPLASGLMLMLFGPACKKAESLTKLDKRYAAEVTLGATSSTGDGEGDKNPVSERVPELSEIEAALAKLTGEITQIPSAYSAIKINGKEAYKRVRAGEAVEMPSRRVMVYENKIVDYEYPILKLASKVSSGTYIRTLAEDLGGLLGTGAYLSGLVRTEVDKYLLKDANVLKEVNSASISAKLLTI